MNIVIYKDNECSHLIVEVKSNIHPIIYPLPLPRNIALRE